MSFIACKKAENNSVQPESLSQNSVVEEDSPCKYQVKPEDVKVEWTAYKFTDKTPVLGTFNTYEIKGPSSAKDLTTLVKGLSIDIDASSIESNNAGRNATIREYFFQKFVPAFIIKGEVESFSGEESSGEIAFKINMNSVSHTIPMKYKIDSENNFSAEGKFTMNDFKLKEAYDSIHETCQALHTGEDGIAKTWEEIGLKVTAKYQKQCSS